MLRVLQCVDRMLNAAGSGAQVNIPLNIDEKLKAEFDSASCVSFDDESGIGRVDFVRIMRFHNMFTARLMHNGNEWTVAQVSGYDLPSLIEAIKNDPRFSKAVDARLWLERKLNRMLGPFGCCVSVHKFAFEGLNWKSALVFGPEFSSFLSIGLLIFWAEDDLMEIQKADETWTGEFEEIRLGSNLLEISTERLMNHKLESNYEIGVVDFHFNGTSSWACALELYVSSGPGIWIGGYGFDGHKFFLDFRYDARREQHFTTQEEARDAIISEIPRIVAAQQPP